MIRRSGSLVFGFLVLEGVVVAAEEFEVPEGGGSPVGPMLDVVGVAPWGGSVTTFMPAVAVPGDQGSSDGGGDDAGGAAEVEGLGVGAEDDPVDDGVTGGFPHLAGSQHLPGGGFVDPTTGSL
jgi:hypothetical protein